MKASVVTALLVCAVAYADSPAVAPVGTGLWRGRSVTFEIRNGLAIAEGDIVLGRPDELTAAPASTGKGLQPKAIVVNISRYLWPDRIIPYVIDPGLSDTKRITDAVSHWNVNTPMQLVERTTQTNYVHFVKADSGCSSMIGMAGGEQKVNLGDTCTAGNVIHEIGHAVGLFHEQSRNDRDFWIQVLPQNLDKRLYAQYDQPLIAGRDIGGYDFSSIMHYDVTSGSKNGRPVLQTIPAGIPISQRDMLSPADIEAVKRLYGVPVSGTVVSTFPFGLEVIVDGERITTPRAYDWPAGSQHTISVPDPQPSGVSVRYLFGRWSDDGDQTHTITASADTSVYTASFIQQYRMPLTTAPANGGRLEVTPPVTDGWFTTGTEIEVRPIPADGWTFAGWRGFGLFGIHGVSPNPLRTVVLGTQMQYEAVFSNGPVTTVTSEPPGLKVQVDGAGDARTYVTPVGFTWGPGSAHTVNVTPGPQTTGGGVARHTFQGWSDGGSAAHSVTAAVDSTILVARFATQYNVSVQSTSGGQVELTPSSADGYYDAGSTITARPIPAGSNRFLGWSRDLSGSSDPASLTVDDQKLIGASFTGVGQIASTGVVNAASFQFSAAVTPGSIVTLFGVNIGPDSLTTLQLSGNRVTTSLGGYQVTFDEFAAPMIYVAKNQISAVVPFGIAGRPDTVLRLTGPGVGFGGRVSVIPTNPGLFTLNSSGTGQAAALNQNGSVNTADNPAAKGSVIVLYGTGTGVTQPASVDGQVTGTSTLPRTAETVRVRIAGRKARVLYAGGAPGLVAGVTQINVEIPADCPSGPVPVNVAAGDGASPGGVTITVQ